MKKNKELSIPLEKGSQNLIKYCLYVIEDTLSFCMGSRPEDSEQVLLMILNCEVWKRQVS